MPVEPMIWSASSNWSGLLRWVMSPVCSRKFGLTCNALMRPTASLSVSIAVTSASLSNPTWLSEICRKVKLLLTASAACASSSRCRAFGMPPESVQITPVPAHTMHSSAWRRLSVRSPVSLSSIVILLARYRAHDEETGDATGKFRSRDHGCVRNEKVSFFTLYPSEPKTARSANCSFFELCPSEPKRSLSANRWGLLGPVHRIDDDDQAVLELRWRLEVVLDRLQRLVVAIDADVGDAGGGHEIQHAVEQPIAGAQDRGEDQLLALDGGRIHHLQGRFDRDHFELEVACDLVSHQ